MLDLRLYRLTLPLGLLAVIVLMFSVVSRPGALSSDLATDGFGGSAAARLAKRLIEVAPDRTPGGADDGEAADLVGRELAAIEGATVSERRFGGSFEGNDVELRNVVATLPGATSATIVIAAPRDCAAGVCAASSAAATGALVELGRALGTTQHQKTIELVSLDGSAAGAAGARRLAEDLRSEPARAVLVLYQPGAATVRGPAVIPFSEGPQSTSAALTESAAHAVRAEREIDGSPAGGTVSDFLRLALPADTGDQAPLIAAGSDAVSLASAGELPLPESADGLENLDAKTLGGVGRATLGLTFALDASGEPLQHGPSAYVPLAGKLVPGWALSLLALSLLVPVGVVALRSTVRARRRGRPVLASLTWVLSRCACFLAPVFAAYLLSVVGIVPSPGWPFDPASFRLGASEILVLVLLAALVLEAALFVRRVRLPDEAGGAISPVLSLVSFAGGLGAWIANPYLALLLVPSVHLLMLASLPQLRGRALRAGAAVLGGLILPSIALLSLGDRLDAGSALPWQLLLMFTGGHFGALATLPLCLLAGCALAALTVAATQSPPPPTRRRRDGSLAWTDMRVPNTHDRAAPADKAS